MYSSQHRSHVGPERYGCISCYTPHGTGQDLFDPYRDTLRYCTGVVEEREHHGPYVSQQTVFYHIVLHDTDQ